MSNNFRLAFARFRFSAALFFMVAIFALFSPSSCFAQNLKLPRAESTTTATKVKIGQYKSANFLMTTDLSETEAEELLARLETMLALISRYWGQKNPRVIEMYVVKKLSNWSKGTLPAAGRPNVAAGGGVTISQKRSIGATWQAKAIVFAVADRGTPQHEAVHAYCAQAFGSTGPVWYSEGMAEVGLYWKDTNDKTVQCTPYVLRYLKNSKPKTLKELVDRNQYSGDSWQNYSWRWSLCHFLGYNENYSQRFKPLGIALMSKRSNASFDSVYGTMAKEIEFEHQLFLKNMEIGYRVDLCTWDWKTKFRYLTGKRTAMSKIKAGRGWQATRLKVKQGESFQYETTGTWAIEKEGEKLTAAGDAQSRGKLVGILFNDYVLSEPFALGESGTFTAPSQGKLYVRCAESWEKIADNKGAVTLKIKVEAP